MTQFPGLCKTKTPLNILDCQISKNVETSSIKRYKPFSCIDVCRFVFGIILSLASLFTALGSPWVRSLFLRRKMIPKQSIEDNVHKIKSKEPAAPQVFKTAKENNLKFQDEKKFIEALKEWFFSKSNALNKPDIISITRPNIVIRFPDLEPNIIIKYSRKVPQAMKRRYRNILNAQKVCIENGLDKLVIPTPKLLELKNKDGQPLYVLVEEKLDIDVRDYRGEDAESLELLKQFIIFICKTGYWDIKPKNNPYVSSQVKLALIDLENLTPPKEGCLPAAFDSSMGWHKLKKFRRCSPIQKQVIIEAAKTCGYDLTELLEPR